jgi:hypothetical protein
MYKRTASSPTSPPTGEAAGEEGVRSRKEGDDSQVYCNGRRAVEWGSRRGSCGSCTSDMVDWMFSVYSWASSFRGEMLILDKRS